MRSEGFECRDHPLWRQNWHVQDFQIVVVHYKTWLGKWDAGPVNVQNSNHIDIAIKVFWLKTKDDDIRLKLLTYCLPAQESLPHVIAANAEIHHFRAYTHLL